MKWKVFDGSQYLESDQSLGELLADALETGDAAYISHALGVAARSQGMTEIARKTGLSRESLYKALHAEGNPEFATVMRVMNALGVTITTKSAA